MNNEKLLNLILAVAIVLLVITNLVSPKSSNEPVAVAESHAHDSSEVVKNRNRRNSRPSDGNVNVGEIVYNNIITGSSVRSYTDELIENELLERIVKAGMAAPTAMNKQPWKFVIVTDKELIKKLSKQPMFSTGAAAIVVCGDMNKTMAGTSKEYWIQDTSAATENILLAAHGFGLGAVWTGVYPTIERVKNVQSVLNMPENIIPLCVIVLGHPSQEPTIKDKWLPENLIWNKF